MAGSWRSPLQPQRGDPGSSHTSAFLGRYSQRPSKPLAEAEGGVSVEALLPGQRLEQQRAADVSYVNTGNAIRSVLQDGVQVN